MIPCMASFSVFNVFRIVIVTSEVEFVIQDRHNCTFTIICIFRFEHSCGRNVFTIIGVCSVAITKNGVAIMVDFSFPVDRVNCYAFDAWNCFDAFDIITIYLENEGVI